MLKKFMLKKNKEFRYVYNHNSSVSSPYMVILYTKNKYGPKFGFSVGKKLGNAVKRNRIKRLFRESMRMLFKNVNSGYSYLFIARAKCVNASCKEISEDIEKLLKKASLFIEG